MTLREERAAAAREAFCAAALAWTVKNEDTLRAMLDEEPESDTWWPGTGELFDALDAYERADLHASAPKKRPK